MPVYHHPYRALAIRFVHIIRSRKGFYYLTAGEAKMR